MKKTIILTLVTLFASITLAEARERDLSKMNERRRTEHLLRVAKETVMRLGPEYYREIVPPVIEGKTVTDTSKDLHWSEIENFLNRFYYTVQYPYNESVESFHAGYAAKVWIWRDTGVPFKVFFGNGFGIGSLDDPDFWKGIGDDWVMPYERRPPRERPERQGERPTERPAGGRPTGERPR